LFVLLTDLMSNLMEGKKANEEDMVKVKSVFNLDEGRRLFTSLLETAITSSPSGSKELSTNNFELLLFLINSCLNVLKLENGADYICAKIILQTAEIIYRKVKILPAKPKDLPAKKDSKKWSSKRQPAPAPEPVKETEECVMPFIKDHFVWEHLSFWEEYFWDVIAKSFQDAFGHTSDYTDVHKQFIEAKLKVFGKSMIGWGRMTPEDIEKFIKKIQDEVQSEESLDEDDKKEQNGQNDQNDQKPQDDNWGSASSSSDDKNVFANEPDTDSESVSDSEDIIDSDPSDDSGSWEDVVQPQ